MTPPIVRFAPSPTGRLHLGNLRTALVNYLYARRHGGTFMLRIDDTDQERSTAEFQHAIEADLRWLGLDWDLYARQSDRSDRYAAAIERLKAAGRLYPSFESPEELELKRKLAMSRGRPPIYDRAALKLTAEEIARRFAAGEAETWRLRLDPGAIAWDDLVRGPTEFHAEHLSDPVLVRADGLPLYTLSSVVDDIEFGISHIIRGEDHVANTAVQIQLFDALGGGIPGFAHFALIADAEGGKLSKRTGSLSVEALRSDGIERMTLLSLLAKLGTSDPVEIRQSLDQLVAEFDIAKFGRARPKLDPGDLVALNAKLLHETPFEAVRDRLPDGAGEAFWLAVRGNLERLGDADFWWRVCRGPIEPVVTDRDFAETAARLLPEGDFDEMSWGSWTQAVKQVTGRKGRELFLPLRLALTGVDHGPELAKLLPLIRREPVLARLTGANITTQQD